MAKKNTEVKPMELGLVLYTDGGCRPSRGIGGWGVHGYSYNIAEDVPKSFKKSECPTTRGYQDAGDFGKLETQPVAPITYFDSWGSLIPETTNNEAEMIAMRNALALAKDKGAKELHLLMDSQYAMKGLTEWSDKWAEEGWVKKGGVPVPNAELWQSIRGEYADITSAGINVTFSYVPGHSDNLGNDKADYLATRGLITGKKGISESVALESDTRGYWNPPNDYNRLFALPAWYFLTNAPSDYRSKDGRYVYHIGHHLNEIEMLGKPVSDHAFAVLFLKEPEPVLETVREYQDAIMDNSYSSIVVAHLNRLLMKDQYHEIATYGNKYLQRDAYANYIMSVRDEVLTQEARPPRKAYDAAEALSSLELVLESVLSGNSRYVLTDVTSYFYETETIKGKEVCKLNGNIKQATRSVDVVVNYNTTGELLTSPLTLTVAQDTPNRNALAALAEKFPKVTLVTYRESEVGFRYAMMISTGDDASIWSSIYANLKVILDN